MLNIQKPFAFMMTLPVIMLLSSFFSSEIVQTESQSTTMPPVIFTTPSDSNIDDISIDLFATKDNHYSSY